MHAPTIDHISRRRKFESLRIDGFREMSAEIFQDTVKRVMDGDYDMGKRVQINDHLLQSPQRSQITTTSLFQSHQTYTR